jgi:nicotinate-nucleotide pyrophosphorylase (carboxylating)
MHGISPDWLTQFITAALSEDVGTGDHTSLATLPKGAVGRVRCLIKGEGVLAGVEFARAVFAQADASVHFTELLADGTPVGSGDIAFTAEGPTYTLLTCERLVLNVMQRLSGIANQASRAAAACVGTKCRVLDTRKTTPLLRPLEKWAVRIGGSYNHRFGLSDMILIKDNHVDLAGGILPALHATRAYLDRTALPLDVVLEVRTQAELEQALSAIPELRIPQRILLDNYSPDRLREAVAFVAGRVPLEASGGITLDNLSSYAQTGVDFVSMGALTHSVSALDISLKAY